MHSTLVATQRCFERCDHKLFHSALALQYLAFHGVCVCVSTPGQRVFHRHLLHQFSTKFHSQGGQACHIQPGPTKLGCGRGSTKGRFGVYLRPTSAKAVQFHVLFPWWFTILPPNLLFPSSCAGGLIAAALRQQCLTFQVIGPMHLSVEPFLSLGN